MDNQLGAIEGRIRKSSEMKQLSIEEENELIKKNQIFLCIDSSGYGSRIKPKNHAEKMEMYNIYPLVVQVGFRASNKVILILEDDSELSLYPNEFKLGNLYNNSKKFITNRKIKTVG